MSEELCPKCGMVPLEGCDGRGHIPVGPDGNEMRLCRNLFAKAMRQHLGPEISSVQHVKSSPLLQRNAEGGFLVDLTNKNVLIQGCTWAGLLPHIKLALATKGLFHSFRIVTDQQINMVFLGNSHRKVQPEGRLAYNSVGDLIGEDIDLVIIKLGYLGYKNKAAPGALKEALLVRESLGLPAWIVEDPDYPWLHSRNADVEQFIDSRYEEVHIDDTSERIAPDVDDMGVDPDPDDGLEPIVKRPVPRANPRPFVAEDAPDLELPGEAEKKKWGKNR